MVNQVKHEFNGLGQLTGDWQEHAGAVTGSSPRVQYGYAELAGGANHSRPASMTYPNGRVLSYDYGTAGGLDDRIGRLVAQKDGATTLEGYDYLGLGAVVRRAHPQPGVDLTYVKQGLEGTGDAGDQYTGLDRFGRVADQRWLKTSGGTHADRFQYTYDRDSNRTARANLVNAGFNETYTYDGLNQLASFARGAHTQSWDPDALGNFESVTTDGVAQARTHNRQNEVTAVGGATAPTYDANGNLTADQAGRQYVYDAWDRLVRVKDALGATIADYKYDALGRRVREVRGGTTTDLYYSAGWQVLEERVGGQAKAQYVWGLGYVDALVLRDRDADGNGTLEERLYAQQDANYNVTALLDNSGNVVERYAYDPFGAVTVYDGSWTVRPGGSSYGAVYLYQGLRYDAAAGLYHARHRDLHPTLGRPLQRDPLGFAAGDVNPYRWVGNGPANATDPSGLKVAPKPPAGSERWSRKRWDQWRSEQLRPTGGPSEGPGWGSGAHWTDVTGVGGIINGLYNGGDYLWGSFYTANRLDGRLQEVTERGAAKGDWVARFGNPNYRIGGVGGGTTNGSGRSAFDPSFNARRQTAQQNATDLATGYAHGVTMAQPTAEGSNLALGALAASRAGRAVTTASVARQPEIAAGLGGRRNIQLQGHAERTGGTAYWGWEQAGLTSRPVRGVPPEQFGQAAQEAFGNASRIHFDLTNIVDPVASAQQGARLGWQYNNLTNAELNLIRSQPDLLQKATFYRDGRVVPNPFDQ